MLCVRPPQPEMPNAADEADAIKQVGRKTLYKHI